MKAGGVWASPGVHYNISRIQQLPAVICCNSYWHFYGYDEAKGDDIMYQCYEGAVNSVWKFHQWVIVTEIDYIGGHHILPTETSGHKLVVAHLVNNLIEINCQKFAAP